LAERVCPFWVGYILASPLRRLIHNPRRILGDYVKPGMKVLDIGCAMGFFSIGMAKMVGPNGHVVCVDLQDRMIQSLRRRATRAGLTERIETRVCTEHSLEIDDLTDKVDFILAFYVIHEVPNIPDMMTQLHKVLKPGGKFLVVEPKGHTTVEEYKSTKTTIQKLGFTLVEHPNIKRDRATLFKKN